MKGLGDVVAELLERSRATAAPVSGPVLETVSTFGANPGGLRMRMHTPEGLAPQAPLVVVLHGCGQTAAGYAAGAGWLELADRHGFALLCPEQVHANNANLCFNWFEDADIRRGSGEAESVAQMVRHAVRAFDLDPRRVFVTGLSAGGAMTAVMLAAYPELFAAGAVIAGLPYGVAIGVGEAMGAMRHAPLLPAKALGDKVRSAAPAPARRPRISIWHGDADSTVTPAAGEALVRQWCAVHAAVQAPSLPTGSPRHSRRTWLGSDGAVAVEAHTIAGLGHGTPIAAGGADGCGAPGPWVLEAGVSSSREIARAWGVDTARAAAAPDRPRAEEAAPVEPVARRKPLKAADVGETIARALSGAGLMP